MASSIKGRLDQLAAGDDFVHEPEGERAGGVDRPTREQQPGRAPPTHCIHQAANRSPARNEPVASLGEPEGCGFGCDPGHRRG